MIAVQQNYYRASDTDLHSSFDFEPSSSTTSLLCDIDSSHSKLFMSQPHYFGLPQSSFPNFDGAQQLFSQNQANARAWVSAPGNDQPQNQSRQARSLHNVNLSTTHRRIPSGSSTFSHTSTSFANSPHMNQVYEQPRQFLSPWEAQQSPSNVQRHLPTPSHTPTQDSFPAPSQQHPNSTPRISNNVNYDLPVTPRTMNGDDFDAQFQPPARTVPKLDRTISDIYQDELYNPTFSQPAAQPQQRQQQVQQSQGQPQGYNPLYLQPHHPNMVNERLQAANQARSASPGGERLGAVSPFRQGSPFATASAFGQVSGHMQSAAETRQQQKALADAMAIQQHRARANDSQPKTISPKDAVLDYKQDADESSIPLFPQSGHSTHQQQHGDSNPYASQNGGRGSQYNIPATTFDFGQPSSQMKFENGEQYGSVSFQPSNSQSSQQSLDFPAHLVSMETSKSEDIADGDEAEDVGAGDDDDEEDDEEDDDKDYDEAIQRPAKTTADTGTYTCTYHGCRERFESPARLQKHKREDHRSTGHGGPPAASASPSASTMTQAGPHRCDRINPQTGKPCNTVFSRPYDLTRHEDTIHNRQKTKVRCHLCTDEKTFSRSDALTRHMKVVHPTASWPAKHKKRI